MFLFENNHRPAAVRIIQLKASRLYYPEMDVFTVF